MAAESQTVFPKTVSDGITLSGNGVSLKMTPTKPVSSGKLTATTEKFSSLNSAVTKIDSQKVAYAYDTKTALEYQLTYTGFKEDIVVSEYTGQTEYHFLLETNGLALTKIDESYYLTDENGEIRATVGDIIIFTADERNNALGSMTHTAVRENEQYIMTIHVDADYLKDEKTKYPIRIDPTMEITYDNCGTGAIQDVTINSNAGSSGSSGSVYVGYRENYGISRTLIKFPYIDFTGFWPQYLVEITFEMRDILCQSEELAIEAYIFTGGSWSESSASWTSVQPHEIALRQDTEYISYSNGVNLSPAHRYSFDITTAAKNWSNGVYPQNGILLKARSTVEYGSNYIFKTFASYNRASNKPSLILKYINPNAVSPPEGELESVTSTQISGWAYVPDAPQWSVNITLELVNTITGEVYPTIDNILANKPSPEVAVAGYGSGNNGFCYEINWAEYSAGVYKVTASGKVTGYNSEGVISQNPLYYTNHFNNVCYSTTDDVEYFINQPNLDNENFLWEDDNLQLRANCYAFALRVFYGYDAPLNMESIGCYQAFPGEFAHTRTYDDLLAIHKNYFDNSLYTTDIIMNFIKEDLAYMGYDVLSEHHFSTASEIPDAVPGKRLILLVHNGRYYHFLMQNSDNTWSQKNGPNPATNKCLSGHTFLTNDNILDHMFESGSGEAGSYTHYLFFYTDKPAIIDYAHNYGDSIHLPSYTDFDLYDCAGNYFESAKYLRFVSSTISGNGKAEYRNDVDYYYFTAQQTKAYTFSLNNNTTSADGLVFKLYDDEKNLIDYVALEGTSITRSYNLQAGTRYYFSINSYDTTQRPEYSFSLG